MGQWLFKELSTDLKDTFPNMSGFSVTNLKYMKRVYLFYNQENTIRQQPVDELENLIFSIPWGRQMEIITKSQNNEKRNRSTNYRIIGLQKSRFLTPRVSHSVTFSIALVSVFRGTYSDERKMDFNGIL